VALTGEEDVVSYWDLPVRLWRCNLTVVVADGLRPWRRPSHLQDPGARQTCRSTSDEERERDALDSSPCLTWAPLPLFPKRGPSWNNPTSASTPSRRALPLPLEDRIARAIGPQLSLSTCHLILITLHDPLFLREMIKYIQ